MKNVILFLIILAPMACEEKTTKVIGSEVSASDGEAKLEQTADTSKESVNPVNSVPLDNGGDGDKEKGEDLDPDAGDDSDCTPTDPKCPPEPSPSPNPSPSPSPRPACEGGDKSVEWKDGNGHCYMFYELPATFSQARTICLDRGGYLATITGKEEALFLYETFGSMGFFGLTDVLEEGKYIYLAGPLKEQQDAVAYFNWDQFQPNNLGIQNCTVVLETGKWDDKSCGGRNPFYCER